MRLIRRGLGLGGFAAGLAAAAACLAQPSDVTPTSLDRLFSRQQADRGAQLFSAHCATCHTPAEGAELMLARGGAASLGEFHTRLSQIMPPLSTARPDAQGYLDIIAYLARSAGAVASESTVGAEDRRWRGARVMVEAQGRTAAAKAPDLEWKAWRGDLGATGYSPAAQIDATNVGRLRIAWRWSGANFGPSPEARNITTPLMARGVLFATAGIKRDVVAIDASTGETLWMWRPADTEARFNNAPRKGAGRGVAYWSDRKGARIFTVTPGFNLVALDAATGRPIAGFGQGGQVDLMKGLRGLPKTGLPDVGSQSPPLVIGDVVVVGPAHLVGMRPKSKANVKGDVRGFDARTGRLLWTFHTIPERGEPGYETWAAGSAEFSGNAGVWAPMSADVSTGALYLPVEASTSDTYGGARPGANLYSSSLVCLDARTGKVRWSRQLVHHDVWDWDVPATPVLADIPGPGTPRRAVLQVTKQAFLFAFDRDTGEPLWPIVETPVPASDVPGEQASPTQPMPSRPAPFDRQGIGVDDLIDFTPALRAEAIAAVKPYRLGRLMTPGSLAAAPDGTKGTLSLPSFLGGGNWEGGVFDPETGLFYVGSMTQPSLLALTKAPEGSDMGYVAAPGRVPSVRGLPIVKPPWGRITAIDMVSGDHRWSMANADTPKTVAANPALQGVSIPRTGVASRAGLVVTKTLLFAGEGDGGGPVFRAHDKATGRILAEIALPGTQTGLPMTYAWGGRQYVVMAVGDGESASEIVALSVPD